MPLKLCSESKNNIVLLLTVMVDSLLEKFDVNNDGKLDYTEFMKSFVEARQQLGIF